MVRKEQQILWPLLQTRNTDRELIDTVIQILTKFALLNSRTKILIRSGNQTHIDRNLLVAAYRTHLTFLQRPQQLHLHRIRQITDLIQEDRTAIRRHKSTCLMINRTRERALHMAKELRSSQIFWNGSAIYRYKRSLGSTTLRMNASGNILFSRTTGSCHQHRHIRWCHQTYMLIKHPCSCAMSLNIKIRLRQGRRGSL